MVIETYKLKIILQKRSKKLTYTKTIYFWFTLDSYEMQKIVCIEGSQSKV